MPPGYLLRNRYSIQKPLASGYFGDTYLAIDLDYYGQRFVVVKHLKPQSKNPEVLQMARRLFETEAMVLRKLGDKTDRIPTLYAFFEEQDEFYLVQEFITGQTLSQELSNGRLSTLATIQILQEILTGLSVVHQENIIHRDLKPDNIIRRSSDGVLVLIDFGAVKEVRKATLAPKTQASIGFGTEGYMPSEQAMGFPKPASDIYAVGAIGIECLTGQEPHQLFNEETLEFNWQYFYRVSDPKIDPLLGRLAKVLNKMLRQRYLDRYANATEALQAIEDLMRPERSLPPPLSRDRNRAVATRTSLDRAAFLKLMGLGGVGAFSTFTVSQILSNLENSAPIYYQKTGSMEEPISIEFSSIKLNERGDEIDKPIRRAEIFQENLGQGIFLTMVKIPTGKFMMGASTSEEGQTPQERPQHSVEISDFYLGQTLVTQAQWAAIFPETKISKQNRQLPVHSINWLDAIAFCTKLSQTTGGKYRLPSEAEWEYACRAHTTTPFAYGDTIAPSIVNYNGGHPYGQAQRGEFRQQITPVAKFPPNLFGLYDMHGNLWEWCLDEWFDNYNGASTTGAARGDLDVRARNSLRVVRGGSWFSDGQICRSASRLGLVGTFRHQYYGLRVACDPVR